MPISLPWPHLRNAADIASPALLIDEPRMEANLAATLAIAGSPARLRPHLKTHKLPQVVRRLVQLGVTRAKVATVAEAEMAAQAGMLDILLALQPVGPAATRLAQLARQFPAVRWSAIFDDAHAVRAMAACANPKGTAIGAWVDLDVGQHRTGIIPGPEAVALTCEILRHPGLAWRGLHAYDGHLGIPDLDARTRACDEAFSLVEQLARNLADRAIDVPAIVAGGSPTFAIHARRPGVELSPGTCVLWDAGYGTGLPDLDFLSAAMLLTRVISRPGAGRLCLDLGHKAVASEMPHPRVVFPELPDARAVTHSEEHLVVETARAAEFPVGAVLRGIPWHICPTVALHDRVLVARGGRTMDRWPVVARARRLNF